MSAPSIERIREVNRSILLFLTFVGLATALLYLAFVTTFAEGQEIGQAGNKTTFPSPTLTGTWKSQYTGFHAEFILTGDSVIGRTQGLQPGAIRGVWLGGYLVLTVNHAVGDRGACDRSTFVATGEGVGSEFSGRWLNDRGTDKLSRMSTRSAGPFEYPYEEELKACGDLVVYEFSFQKDSDVVQGRQWPILSALTGLLKKDPSLKIRITGHTDPSGDASVDDRVSLGRAEAVKKKLVRDFGADPARILTEGAGAEQPIDDNATELGRMANRRIEIVAEQSCARIGENLAAEDHTAGSALVLNDVVDAETPVQVTSAQSGCGAQGPLQVIAEYARLRTKKEMVANRTELQTSP